MTAVNVFTQKTKIFRELEAQHTASVPAGKGLFRVAFLAGTMRFYVTEIPVSATEARRTRGMLVKALSYIIDSHIFTEAGYKRALARVTSLIEISDGRGSESVRARAELLELADRIVRYETVKYPMRERGKRDE